MATKKAGAARPGVRGKGEPNQTRRPRAQTLKSSSGARSPAGSDGGGACAAPSPRPPPCSVPPPFRGLDHKSRRALRRRLRSQGKPGT